MSQDKANASQLDICIIGKYPPIQGGVSRSNLWDSIALIQRGCSVSLVTNAAEVEASYRTDSALYESYVPALESLGFDLPDVTSTVTNERQIRHIPAANPYVSKLAGLAAEVSERRHVDLFVGHYLEPYGVAAALTASWTGIPYGLRNAGSDVGRLYQHPGLRQAYENIARSADFWLTTDRISRGLQLLGVDPARVYNPKADALPPQLFNPNTEPLPLAEVIEHWRVIDPEALNATSSFDPGLPTIGMYGKLGVAKGSLDILAAAAELRDRGIRVNLVIVTNSGSRGASRLRHEADRLEVSSQLTLLPFIPAWGVPNFIRACNAVAFLERDFDIAIHRPKIPREVFACGTCLILSHDIAQRASYSTLLDDRRNVILTDPRQPSELASALGFVVKEPEAARELGAEGRKEISERIEDWDTFASNLYDTFVTIADDVAVRRYEMSVAEMQTCFARLCADRAYRRWFDLAPDAALVDYELTEEESRCLREIDRKMLEAFAQSLIGKRRKTILDYFPLSVKVAPAETEQMFTRYYDLHPARPRERLTDLALAFGDFLRESIGSRCGAPRFAADIATYELLELRARLTTSASDSLAAVNGRSEPKVDVITPETRLALSEGLQIGEFACDVATAVKQLRDGETPTFEPTRQILVICPASADVPTVYRVESGTRQLLEACRGGLSFGDLEARVPEERREAVKKLVSSLLSRSILQVI